MSAPVDLLFDGIGRGISALGAAADPDLPALLCACEGRRLALVVRGTDRVLEAEVQGGALRVVPPRRVVPEGLEAAAEPASGAEPDPTPGGPAPGADLTLAGSVPDFLRFLAGIRREPLPEEPFGRLEVHGDPEARAEFVELLRRIDPDWEALLARAVGGVAAHAMSRTTLGRLFHARRSAARLVDDLAEYLEEESRLVPDPPARTRFADGVRALADKVAELEERLDRKSHQLSSRGREDAAVTRRTDRKTLKA